MGESMCQYCMRFDCEKKGGPVDPCPVERKEMMKEKLFLESYERFRKWLKSECYMEERPQWSCHICGEIRFDEKISVLKKISNIKDGAPCNNFQENIRYCNDREDCIQGAYKFSFFKREENPE